MSTPNKYITAQSWNGTEFYFNVYEQTWQRAEDTALSQEHDATDADMADALIRARAEKFMADNIELVEYVDC